MKVRQVLWGAAGGAALGFAVVGFGRTRISAALRPKVTAPLTPMIPSGGGRKGIAPARDAFPVASGAAVAVASLSGPFGDGMVPSGAQLPAATPAADAAHPAPLVGNATDLHPEALLGVLAKETRVFEKPSAKSRVLGLVRTGALLRRAVEPAGTNGCKDGWYRVEPEGYVCVGKTATLELDHPVLQISSYQPDRSRPLPYIYGRSRYPTPPLYTRLPSRAEQAQVEHDLGGHLAKNLGAGWAQHADTPPPELLAGGERVPRPFAYPRLERDFVGGRALVNSAFAFIDMFEADGRRYGLTVDLSILPLDRLSVVEASEFAGRVLPEGADLHLAFVRSEREHLYGGNAETGALAIIRPARYRESFLLSGRRFRVAGQSFLETTDGQFLKDGERLVRVEPRAAMPKWATGKRTWIDVSILRQTLVAYEGARPRFATLISTGRDGLGDPLTTHSTAQGVFLIHTKHVTATMSGDTADDEFDLRDVPYVQYFHEGYAFHAAFWHDGFGSPRSHGCINLSPADARYLFTWTDPPVPMRWHSALSLEGTLVYIHP